MYCLRRMTVKVKMSDDVTEDEKEDEVRMRFMIMMITMMKNRLNVKDTVLVNAMNSFILQVKHFKILKFSYFFK